MNVIGDLLIGGIATMSLIAALFFLQFYRATRDRFFVYFALSFALEGLNRVLLYLAATAAPMTPTITASEAVIGRW